MKAKYCSNCGSRISQESSFCGNCGEKNNSVQIEKNNCPGCGYATSEDEKYCPECGTPVKSESRESQSSPNGVKSREETKPAQKESISAAKTNQGIKKKRGCLPRFFKWVFIVALLIMGLAVSLIEFGDTDIFKESSANSQKIKDQIEGYEKNKKVLDLTDIHSADKYRHGIDVNPDQYEAFERYTLLAEKGDLNALISLSEYYEQGIWVKKDTEKAKDLLKKAAKEGSIEAKWQLEFLESNSQ